MSDLDDKLREILDYEKDADWQSFLGRAIPQIKQAFADEGYEVTNGLKKFYAVNMMTGRHWYDRFNRELEIVSESFDTLRDMVLAMPLEDRKLALLSIVGAALDEAAKKAAGSPMSGTVTGGIKAAEKNKARFGSDFYSRIGRAGGSKRSPRKGFGSNHKLASKAGRLGGTRSRRGPAL